MTGSRAGRWGFVGLLSLFALTAAGCATDRDEQTKEQEAVPRPEWRLGDQWVFQRTLVSGASVVVTHQVVATTPEGYTLRVLGPGGAVTRQWTSDLHLIAETLGGGATSRYDPPASYFSWPITPAKTWTQEFRYTDGRNDGDYTNTWKVSQRVEPVDVVGGRFYTLRIERWGGAQRLEAYWYSPRVRYWVRLEDYLRGHVEELVEFRGWGSPR